MLGILEVDLTRDDSGLLLAGLLDPVSRAATRICVSCGEAFAPPARRRGSLQKLCSPACRRRTQSANEAARCRTKSDAAKAVPRRCPECGEEYHPEHLNQKYCTPSCADASLRAERKCIEPSCGKLFSAVKRQGQQACSQSCAARYVFTVARKVKAQCRGCGCEFERPANRPQKFYCTDSCRDRVRKKRRHLYLNTWARLRVEKMKEGEYESIDPVTVFERDAWTCWLCGVGVNREATHPDSMAPTIDHVMPLSRGGTHTYANVRCAHSICNTRKNSKIPEECGQAGAA